MYSSNILFTCNCAFFYYQYIFGIVKAIINDIHLVYLIIEPLDRYPYRNAGQHVPADAVCRRLWRWPRHAAGRCLRLSALHVWQLLLTHFSNSLETPVDFLEQAQAVFPQTVLGEDLFTLSLNYQQERA